MSEIFLYNTKTHKKEHFIPFRAPHVTIYSCGPTVYHFAHIGNLRMYVFADTLRRMLNQYGYQVTHVINITDVGHLTDDGNDGEDKLEKGSRREGVSAWDVAKKYTEAFMHDLTSLGIPLEAYQFPRATAYVSEQIAFVQALESKGHTYTIPGDGVYFDISTFPTYRDFARLPVYTGSSRIGENDNKRNPEDFALWKFSPGCVVRHMQWDSPWGPGFPGWHIECSAMGACLLGDTLDIHTGGIDHIRVHHTNEIAQSESYFGGTHVGTWMHGAFLQDHTGKMSKSNDEFLTLSSLTDAGYSPRSYRYLLLQTHYRKELEFSFESLTAASAALMKLDEFVRVHYEQSATSDQDTLTKITQAMQDDLHTPQALALLHAAKGTLNPSVWVATLLASDVYFGLSFVTSVNSISVEIPQDVIQLADERILAKRNKDFAQADSIRARIAGRGFDIIDEKDSYRLEKRA